MAGLFEHDRHEALADVAWDEAQVRSAIARIAAETQKALTNRLTSSTGEAEGRVPDPSLYSGAAGLLWGLRRLGAAGFVHEDRLGDAVALLRDQQFGEELSPSYLVGDAGLRLALYDADPTPSAADRLHDCIARNVTNPAIELMWGAPGSMLAAVAMHRRTGESRWGQTVRNIAKTLETTFDFDPDLGARIWTQDLYGSRLKYLGLVHGFAGIAFALIRGRELLGEADWTRWSSRLAETLARSAVRSGRYANWFAGVSPHRPGRIMPVQVCHGAPGMVIGLSDLPESIDDFLIAAGELVWTAGPLTKGTNLCHGTAGNGYALLKLYKRSGDSLWLDRARAFAMHAMAQADASATGAERHGLWTGDLGLALHLVDCLNGDPRFPTLDD